MRNYVLTLFLVLVLLGMAPVLCACGARDVNGTGRPDGLQEEQPDAQQEGQAEKQQTDMDFTVCEAGRLPAELVELIESKKAEPFRLTFTTREYMYIVVGYGAQPRGGCSVTVNELYRTEDAVHIKTNLVGVEGETIRIDGMTYPYVAVKCENQNLPVVYE